MVIRPDCSRWHSHRQDRKGNNDFRLPSPLLESTHGRHRSHHDPAEHPQVYDPADCRGAHHRTAGRRGMAAPSSDQQPAVAFRGHHPGGPSLISRAQFPSLCGDAADGPGGDPRLRRPAAQRRVAAGLCGGDAEHSAGGARARVGGGNGWGCIPMRNAWRAFASWSSCPTPSSRLSLVPMGYPAEELPPAQRYDPARGSFPSVVSGGRQGARTGEPDCAGIGAGC